MNSPRIAILGVIPESNRQAEVATRADFEDHYILEGEALLAAARADNSVIALETAAFVLMVDATGSWEPLRLMLASCFPSGPVDGSTVREFIAAIIHGLKSAATVDGVSIANYGAMVATDSHDPDGDLIAAIRAQVAKSLQAFCKHTETNNYGRILIPLQS